MNDEFWFGTVVSIILFSAFLLTSSCNNNEERNRKHLQEMAKLGLCQTVTSVGHTVFTKCKEEYER